MEEVLLTRNSRHCCVCKDTIFRSKSGTRCFKIDTGYICVSCASSYKIKLNVDCKPLTIQSQTTLVHIQRIDVPLYDGPERYRHNPFWIACAGFSEFAAMKMARREFSPMQVLEIRDVKRNS